MAFNSYLNHIRRLTALIQQKATGSPDALAKRLNVSRSKVFYLLKSLREDYEVPIYYDDERQSYCFSREGKFFIGFLEK
jgi:DNA-binding transcriptional regulator LsrR (DeoR family)